MLGCDWPKVTGVGSGEDGEVYRLSTALVLEAWDIGTSQAFLE